MSLANLVQFATKTQTKGQTPFYALSIEEARSKVVIRDARKPQKDDEGNVIAPTGDVPLSLYAGKIRVALDAISDGATAVTVPEDQVEVVTEQLQAALTEGEFDSAIVEAQTKGREAAEKAQASKAAGESAEAVDAEPQPDAEVNLDELG